jgi:hypothetical protein
VSLPLPLSSSLLPLVPDVPSLVLSADAFDELIDPELTLALPVPSVVIGELAVLSFPVDPSLAPSLAHPVANSPTPSE